MKNRYRIVSDKYAGYEVQIKYWFLPFWIQADFTNTFRNIDRAKEFMEKHKRGTNRIIYYSE